MTLVPLYFADFSGKVCTAVCIIELAAEISHLAKEKPPSYFVVTRRFLL
jgi:hypothetical protein